LLFYLTCFANSWTFALLGFICFEASPELGDAIPGPFAFDEALSKLTDFLGSIS